MIEILGSDDGALAEISRRQLLSLDRDEMRALQSYFRAVGRNPTDCELETIAQTWSEHCVHKTFKADIRYTESVGGVERHETVSLLKEIAGVTRQLRKRWCLSVFEDNAGVIDFAGGFGVAFKVETHNHPSALEPYGGAGTGIGGVIRDILGVGMGARPILNTDVFCFGLPDTPPDDVPDGVLHPRRVFKGVVSGVRDYGNRMGIPTGNGAILFDQGYLHNCLVFCGTLGIIPCEKVFKEVKQGDRIVVIGGRTGRDGIHGATFSSASLEKDIPTSVVQIGNPIMEKKVLDVLLAARDKGLFNAVTDCGAGGLSSAVGEMGKDLGADVVLDKVPLKYADLEPWEIWISEAQERMVLAVPPAKVARLLALCRGEDVEVTVIGTFGKTGRLVLRYEGKKVCDIGMLFLHDGVPHRRLAARFTRHESPAVSPAPAEWKDAVLQVLKDPNIASKEAVIRQYDHEVQSQTILKPLVGVEGKGPADAVVLKPLYDRWEGVAVACGINPFYGRLDPHAMAGCCIEEAVRNIVCAGGDPEYIALLDNFCWGDVRQEDELGRLVRCVKGCREYALAYKAPFISGKDSLNNFFTDRSGGKVSIPGTLLISAVGKVKDIRKTVSSDLKEVGNHLYCCGTTYRELGGSQYYRMFHVQGGVVPRPRPDRTFPLMKKIHRAIRNGWIGACHDCSDGGFATAIAEMVIGGAWGADIFLSRMVAEADDAETLLFSESQGRFIVEVKQAAREKFERLMEGEACGAVGVVVPEPVLKIRGREGIVCEIPQKELDETWRTAITW